MTSEDKLINEMGLRWGELTFGDVCALAEKTGRSAGQMAVFEAAQASGLPESEIGPAVWREFAHNLTALDKGLEDESRSFLFGKMAGELGDPSVPPLTGTPLLDKAVRYTFATQVGNHCVGLRPCAGTGDSCSLTGLAKAMSEEISDPDLFHRALAVLMKVAVLFRVAKTTTGCNLEGFGAGAAAAAAAFCELFGAPPRKTERAVVLAISPTVSVPCTPRVMVPGLCATHIGGAVLVGWLAAFLSRHTTLPVNVPVDLMMSMAAAVHPVSAKEVVPVVIEYMEPFFKVNPLVEDYIPDQVKAADRERRGAVARRGAAEARQVAAKAGAIIKPFGDAVVGGSSQAVGSPANTARLAHALAEGRITKITIELYPELFARRAINIPAILMGGVYGRPTDDAQGYLEVMDKIKKDGIEVEIVEVSRHQLQKVSLKASKTDSMVAALNRGGARLKLLEASPSREKALEAAKRLGIEVIDN